MVLIRQFEERVKLLFLEGSMPGTIHQAQGQEACAVGVCAALNADDLITSTHRPHGHALAKGLTPDEMMIELFGKGTGSCKGKGGSMHIGNMQRGMVPAIAIVGGGIPLAAGMGLAIKMQGMTQVVACFFGEGATQEGAFHEGVNLAAIWSLPVIFICENNLYGASTNIRKVTRWRCMRRRAGLPTSAGVARVLCCWNCSPIAAPDTRVAIPTTTSPKMSRSSGTGATRSRCSETCWRMN
jgi:TPP-dependent pyruvate/acetoin dehydrogenase alpha subunit